MLQSPGCGLGRLALDAPRCRPPLLELSVLLLQVQLRLGVVVYSRVLSLRPVVQSQVLAEVVRAGGELARTQRARDNLRCSVVPGTESVCCKTETTVTEHSRLHVSL